MTGKTLEELESIKSISAYFEDSASDSVHFENIEESEDTNYFDDWASDSAYFEDQESL